MSHAPFMPIVLHRSNVSRAFREYFTLAIGF